MPIGLRTVHMEIYPRRIEPQFVIFLSEPNTDKRGNMEGDDSGKYIHLDRWTLYFNVGGRPISSGRWIIWIARVCHRPVQTELLEVRKGPKSCSITLLNDPYISTDSARTDVNRRTGVYSSPMMVSPCSSFRRRWRTSNH